MNIWLVDFDGKIENLALMHLSSYHKALGDNVSLKFGAAELDLFSPLPDKVYISCLFRWNRTRAFEYFDRLPYEKEIGGTGIDIKKSLLPQIQRCPPDYALYGNARAIGFISRGCIRRCPWCVVPRKEGKLTRVVYARDIVEDKQEAIFLDNNFLALPGFDIDLRWLIEHQIAIDFNQGLDARLVTPSIASMLAKCRWLAGPRLALDSIVNMAKVGQALDYLKAAGINLGQVFVFCLIGFDGIESDIERLLFLRRYNVNVYPMGYRDLDTGDEPAKGWDRRLYRKYRRLIIRLPHAASVWNDFNREICKKA